MGLISIYAERLVYQVQQILPPSANTKGQALALDQLRELNKGATGTPRSASDLERASQGDVTNPLADPPAKDTAAESEVGSVQAKCYLCNTDITDLQ